MSYYNPTYLLATRNTAIPSQIFLEWDYANNSGYNIYRKEDGQDWILVKHISPEVGLGEGYFGEGPLGAFSKITSWVDMNVEAVKGYTYRICSLIEDQATEILPYIESNHIFPFQIPWVKCGRKSKSYAPYIWWGEMDSPEEYRVYVSFDNGQNFSLVDSTNVPYFNDVPNSDYLEDRIYNIVAVYNGDETVPQYSNILYKEPPKPVKDVVITKNNNDLILNWVNQEDSVHIKIYRIENRKEKILIADLPPNTSTYTDISLGLHTRYEYLIKPYNYREQDEQGEMVLSDFTSINNQIDLGWQRGPNSINDEYFEVERKPVDQLIVKSDKLCVLKGEAGYNQKIIMPALKPSDKWVLLTTTQEINYSDSSFDKGRYYLYSVRARDFNFNYTPRIAGTIQG